MIVLQEVEQLISDGKYFQARVLLEGEALEDPAKHAQLYALSLSKTGIPEKGVEVLEPVFRKAPDDSETAGILGGIYKELFKKKRATNLAIQSRDTYLQNFNQTKSYYTGINAATMSAISMQGSKSRAIAKEVISLIDENTNDFWELATLGEAYLIAKDKDKSRAAYLAARKLSGNQWGKITSVYNQLWLLNHYVPVSSEILNIFLPPNVVAFVGHMIDRPDRPTKRFPPEIESNVRDGIRAAIRSVNAKVGYSSLANGSDILFAEVMEEEGGELNLLLPFKKEDFVEASVQFAGEQWVERFNRLVNKHPVHYITQDAYDGHDDLFFYLIRVVYGSALLRSSINHTSPYLLSVLSKTDLSQKTGGTRDALKAWTLPNRHVNINPDDFVTSQAGGRTPGYQQRPPLKITRPVLYMFHIKIEERSHDATKGLSDRLGSIKEKVMESKPSFFVYSEDSMMVGSSSLFSLIDYFEELRSLLNERRLGFKATFHSGPVYLPVSDPDTTNNRELAMLLKLSSFGITEGYYASQHFAATYSIHPSAPSIEYAGMISDENKRELEVYLIEIP